jgi:hypothetical protein
MMTKKFQCKIEDVPIIGEFLLSSVKKDINDFSGFSSTFTPEFLTTIETKISSCKELTSSSTIVKELKAVTKQIRDKSKGLRVKLNVLEGYLKLSKGTLDIAVEDAGLKNVRHNISRFNIEGLISNVQTLLVAVKRNQSVLEAKGFKPSIINDLETQINEINVLNTKQNDLISDRNRTTKQNITLFNDLWENITPIVETAKALYRGVDETKLKDYTIAQLIKRINAGKRKEKEESSEETKQ